MPEENQTNLVIEGDFSLTVTFRDVGRSPHSIPDDVLERMGVEVAKLIVVFFQADKYKTAGITAKSAYDSHRQCPYPGDAYQLALDDAESLMVKCLMGDFGPTAARSLHPLLHFTRL